jgi:ABC-type protease/lipase transport system fused ATPase/permease subunit
MRTRTISIAEQSGILRERSRQACRRAADLVRRVEMDTQIRAAWAKRTAEQHKAFEEEFPPR